MKKFIVLILTYLVFQVNTYAQRDSVLIVGSIFTCMYSETKQQPLWVKYNVQCVNGKVPRTGMDFYTVPGVITSDGKDYEANVWDKGHCAPAADFNCTKETLHNTFSYLNCVLQHEKLNRGVWRLLEVHERNLAVNAQVTVRIQCVYKNSIVLNTGATVPSGFYKYIYVNNKLYETYYFDNATPMSSDFRKYLIP
jgi:endonuclease G, mitochondrial